MGVVARLHAHVDDAHCACLHGFDAALDRGLQLRRFRDRPDAFGALRASHHGEVDVRFADALADPAVLDRTRALSCAALLTAVAPIKKSPSPMMATGSLALPFNANAAPTVMPGPAPTPPPPSEP